METFSASLAICAGNSPVPGEFPSQRSVTRSFDIFFDLRLNTRLSKHWWGWWFETPSPPLWHYRNVTVTFVQWNDTEWIMRRILITSTPDSISTTDIKMLIKICKTKDSHAKSFLQHTPLHLIWMIINDLDQNDTSNTQAVLRFS